MKEIYTIDLNIDKSGIPYFSSSLVSKIEENLNAGKKTIIYINKRGDFSSLICQDCQNIYKCPRCDISLSVHKNPAKLLCHHCSYEKDIPIRCENCNSTNLKKIGIGTEQVEENLQKLFPGVNIFRFDLDSMKNKTSKNEAIENLKQAQIIVGTKMITTGFDLENVGLIAIILLEQELQIPDYKTEENLYSNIKQLIGRGGRKGEDSQVIIQTFIPNNEIVKNISQSNYKDFFKNIINERKIFKYPPFTQMAIIEYRDISEQKAKDFINMIKLKLDSLNTEKLYEIELNNKAFKRNNNYIYKIIVKGDDIRGFLANIKKEILKNSKLQISFE